MNQKPSPASRFIAEVRLGARGSGAHDTLDWPSESSRSLGRIERIEEIISMVFFFAMFVSVLVAVFWRYVLDNPLVWTVNGATIGFIWTVLIGAGLPNWTDDHIQFDLLYRRMSPRWQRTSRIAGNLLLTVTFALPIPATWDYLVFIGEDTVTGLPLTFNWAFAVILWFLVATVLHRGRMVIEDVREVVRERGGRGESG